MKIEDLDRWPRHVQRQKKNRGHLNNTCPSSHNDGSVGNMGVSPILVSFHDYPFIRVIAPVTHL